MVAVLRSRLLLSGWRAVYFRIRGPRLPHSNLPRLRPGTARSRAFSGPLAARCSLADTVHVRGGPYQNCPEIFTERVYGSYVRRPTDRAGL